MPSEPYLTVTLRKDVVKKLDKLNSNKSTSALITEAINEYVETKLPKDTKPHQIDLVTMTSGTTSSVLIRGKQS